MRVFSQTRCVPGTQKGSVCRSKPKHIPKDNEVRPCTQRTKQKANNYLQRTVCMKRKRAVDSCGPCDHTNTYTQTHTYTHTHTRSRKIPSLDKTQNTVTGHGGFSAPSAISYRQSTQCFATCISVLSKLNHINRNQHPPEWVVRRVYHVSHERTRTGFHQNYQIVNRVLETGLVHRLRKSEAIPHRTSI
jgi:ribosomal protein L35AE/L33A